MHTKRHIYLFLIAALISALPLNATTPEPAHAATILRVIETGLSSGSCGGDWATNACDLQNALSQAASGDEIWVAAGTYRPTTSTDRTATFQLKTGVALYGGFAGTETLRSERDWATNVTVLSGDIGTVDDTADNSYHVVTGSGTDATAVLDGFTITAGNANGSDPHNAGGGMHNSSGSPTVINITFDGNSAQHGGGIFNDNSSSPSVANATISNNSAAVGGGMHNDNSSNPTVTDVTFSGNSATYGGGMKNDRSSHPMLTNVTFTGNSANFGGGMHNTGASGPMLTDVTFGNNSASLGGGMFNYDSSNSVLADVTFSDNSATVYGGGMYNYASSPALTNVIFSDNSATVYGGGTHNDASSPTLINVIFSGNSADFGAGGGMSNRNFSSPTLTKVTFSDNSAQEGGGMGNYDSSSPLLMNVTFLGNSATYGGGMYNDASSPALTNGIFSGNSAEEGGGIRNVGASNPPLTNVTFSGNSAATYGGGIFNYDGNPTLANSILWGNTAGAAGAQIYTNDAPLITATFSDIQGGWSGTGNIDADPLFVDGDGADDVPGTADDNLRLQPGSPAINAGSNAALPADASDLDGDGDTAEPIPFDLDGYMRTVNGTVDMGAYEHQAEPPVITALQISNLSDTSATLSWLTDRPADSQVHFGASVNLGQIAYDDRGATTTSRTHHVTLSGLTPSTTYFFYVASDDSVDDNGGALYQFSTGPTVALSSPDLIYGQVFLPDGVTPAAGALVYVTLRDGNGQGSPGDAALLSYVIQTSDDGYWNVNLGNARTANLAQPFQYSVAGDRMWLAATDGTACRAEQMVDTGADAPAPSMTLTCPTQVTYNLAAGWNLLALNVTTEPAPLAEQTLDEIEVQGGNATEVDRWLNGGWDAHIHNLPFNDFLLEMGKGYFVKSTAVSAWRRVGWPPSNPLPVALTPGWNLIGLPKLPEAMNAEQLLDGIEGQGGNCTEIDRWLNGGWNGHIHNLPFNNFSLRTDEGYFVKCSQASTYVPQLGGRAREDAWPTLAETAPLTPVTNPAIGDVLVTNRRDVALTVAWRTDQPSDGWVEYGLTPDLGQAAYDDRGREAVSTVHQVTLAGLAPETTYYLRVRSGNSTGDDDKPIQVTTAPTTPPTTPFLAYGQVLNGDGSPAVGALVVVRLGADQDQRSEPFSALVDGAGYWALSLPVDACQTASLAMEVIRPDGSRGSLDVPACAAQPAPAVQFKD